MDFIIEEAEEEHIGNSPGEEEELWEEHEAEEEDTGLGTLFDTDTECTELDNHQSLLNEQQLQDANHLLSQLGDRLLNKGPRKPTNGWDDIRNPKDQLGPTELEVLQPSPTNIPETSRRWVTVEVHRPASPDPNQENHRNSRSDTHTGYQARRPGRSGVENRVPASHKAPVEHLYRYNPYRKPLQSLSVARTINTGGRREASRPYGGTPRAQHRATSEAPQKGPDEGNELLQRILAAKDARHAHLTIFKELYSLSYCDITRIYKSDKTQSHEWVCALIGCASVITEALMECLKAHTEFVLYDLNPNKNYALYYCGFTVSKSREGVRRCFKNFNVQTDHMLIDPPNKRSTVAALFFQRLVVGHGDMPQWCTDIIATGGAGGDGFKLSEMVQWALDNNICDEAQIAYHYAEAANTDTNAQLWLSSNSQAKYVRDCTTMVRHYKRGHMRATPMIEHIAVRMRDHVDQDDGEGWKRIVLLLRYQHCGLQEFLLTLKYWLRGRPKKSTIAIIGVGDSGKTMFSMSLISFLEGRVLSYANSKSHFWLQPLADCKCAVIDDVTWPCWDYFNLYMRNALDGNDICIDCKYRAPMQLKCPPLILTSNYDPRGEGGGETYKYLMSRMNFLCFNRVIPVCGVTPRFLIQAGDWRSFFLKYQQELGLDLQQYDYGQFGEADNRSAVEGD
ncbi:E1 [Pygoscelis adeliae papillomavirus 1]|uniref:Replication protein E1 n=1 Tax=Pygoscelis adeliae papillomavirus 1 TaxID=1480065 RepID=X2JKP9_9PAPI|nr:E1 [Pygoscelis adeliae papillomavirus 1]AHN65801.1 E1 [Pygoscelis adeliae papillomavirus 1]